jgi:hypothetical protein
VIVPNTLLSPLTPEDVEVPAVMPPPAPTVTVIGVPDATANPVSVLYPPPPPPPSQPPPPPPATTKYSTVGGASVATVTKVMPENVIRPVNVTLIEVFICNKLI